MLRTIDRNAHQLLRVADDLAVDPTGRGIRVDFADTDLAGLAGEAVDSAMAARRDAGHPSVLRARAGPVVVHGDPARLHQLLATS